LRASWTRPCALETPCSIAATLACCAAPLAHAGPPTNRSNPILRNDMAHFPPLPAAEPADRSATPIVVRVSGGFDWPAAGVGAAAAFGLVAVGLGSAAATRRVGLRGTAEGA